MSGLKYPKRSKEADQLFKAPEWREVDGRAVKFSDVVVHTINMGDVEDPDLLVAQPIYEWQESEAGKWILDHAVETPFWHRMMNPYNFGWTYYIVARLAEHDQTFWTLKWQKS